VFLHFDYRYAEKSLKTPAKNHWFDNLKANAVWGLEKKQ